MKLKFQCKKLQVVVSTQVKENSTTSDISSWTYSPANGNFLLLWLQCSSFSQFRVKRLPFVICSPGRPRNSHPSEESSPHQANKCPNFCLSLPLYLSCSDPARFPPTVPTRSGFVNAPQFLAPMRVQWATPPEPAAPSRGWEKYMFTARKANAKRKQTLTLGAYNIFHSRLCSGCAPEPRSSNPATN